MGVRLSFKFSGSSFILTVKYVIYLIVDLHRKNYSFEQFLLLTITFLKYLKTLVKFCSINSHEIIIFPRREELLMSSFTRGEN